jgi:ribosomal protein S1
MKQFAADQKITGTVEKVTEQGVVFDLGVEGVEGFVRKEKIPPTTKYEKGQKVNLTVTETDAKRHRVYLTPVLLEKPLMYR